MPKVIENVAVERSLPGLAVSHSQMGRMDMALAQRDRLIPAPYSPKTVLEIGYGGSPMGMELKRFVRELPQNVTYHGVDKPPEGSDRGEYYGLLKNRKSDRLFSNKSVPIGVLAKILGSCRITRTNPERRTYPSAGARYPVELYLIALRVKGLEPGVYHFNVSKFSLETILRADLRKYESEMVSPLVKNIAGAIVLTAVMSRIDIKYGVKAYPFSLLEAGHIGQNISLSCAKYNVGSCAVGGFVNDRITEILDLTKDELPVYVMAFGYPKRV